MHCIALAPQGIQAFESPLSAHWTLGGQCQGLTTQNGDVKEKIMIFKEHFQNESRYSPRQ